jgi:hypothetical protein
LATADFQGRPDAAQAGQVKDYACLTVNVTRAAKLSGTRMRTSIFYNPLPGGPRINGLDCEKEKSFTSRLSAGIGMGKKSVQDIGGDGFD